MEKSKLKKKLAIILIIIIIVVGAIILYTSSSQQIKVGDAYFNVPNGYQAQNVSDKLVRLVSDDKVLYINGNINESNIDKAVSDYVNFKNRSENTSVMVSDLNENGYNFHKSIAVTNSSIVHYWFIKENKIYEIYTSTADSNTDKLISSIVNTNNNLNL